MFSKRALPLIALVLSALAARGAEPDAPTLIKRAVRARGGEAALKRYPAATWKIKGMAFTRGQKVEYSGDVAVEQSTRLHIAVRGENRGSAFSRILVIDGDRGWTHADGAPEELNQETLAEERERLYANHVATLTPLLGGDFRLTLLPEKRVGDHLCVGVNVQRDGHRDVRLFFDKETDLLRSMETTLRDLPTAKDVVQEVRFSDYQIVQGIKQPMKYVIRWDRRKHAEGQWSEVKYLDKLPEALFRMP